MTVKEYTEELNNHNWNIDDLIYLTNPSRGRYVSKETLLWQMRKNKVGKLLKKLDPIAFYSGFNDRNR